MLHINPFATGNIPVCGLSVKYVKSVTVSVGNIYEVSESLRNMSSLLIVEGCEYWKLWLMPQNTGLEKVNIRLIQIWQLICTTIPYVTYYYLCST